MNPGTLLFRQIHPTHLQKGVLSSGAFRPLPRDAGHLSVYDGDQTTAEDSQKHYTQLVGEKGNLLESEAVYAVSVEECTSLELPSHLSAQSHSPHHAHIDFNGHAEKRIEKLSKKLRDMAKQRGCQHPLQ